MRTIDVCYGGLVFFHRKLQKMLHLGYKARRVLNSLIFGYGLQKYAPIYLQICPLIFKICPHLL